MFSAIWRFVKTLLVLGLLGFFGYVVFQNWDTIGQAVKTGTPRDPGSAKIDLTPHTEFVGDIRRRVQKLEEQMRTLSAGSDTKLRSDLAAVQERLAAIEAFRRGLGDLSNVATRLAALEAMVAALKGPAKVTDEQLRPMVEAIVKQLLAERPRVDPAPPASDRTPEEKPAPKSETPPAAPVEPRVLGFVGDERVWQKLTPDAKLGYIMDACKGANDRWYMDDETSARATAEIKRRRLTIAGAEKILATCDPAQLVGEGRSAELSQQKKKTLDALLREMARSR